MKPKTTVEPAKPYISAASVGPISRLACRAMPISAFADAEARLLDDERHEPAAAPG